MGNSDSKVSGMYTLVCLVAGHDKVLVGELMNGLLNTRPRANK